MKLVTMGNIMKMINKNELRIINERVSEITSIIDMCDPDQDAHILYECEIELKFLSKKLEKAVKTAKIKVLGLKLIIGGKKWKK